MTGDRDGLVAACEGVPHHAVILVCAQQLADRRPVERNLSADEAEAATQLSEGLDDAFDQRLFEFPLGVAPGRLARAQMDIFRGNDTARSWTFLESTARSGVGSVDKSCRSLQ